MKKGRRWRAGDDKGKDERSGEGIVFEGVNPCASVMGKPISAREKATL